MIKLAIITHGTLSQSLLETSRLIVGYTSDIEILGLFAEDNPDDFKIRVSDLIDAHKNDDGLILFTDLYGGPSANSIIAKLFELKFPAQIKCCSGVNLPLLLEAITLSATTTITELSDQLDQLVPQTVENILYRFNQ